jgi:hypothetical protein
VMMGTPAPRIYLRMMGFVVIRKDPTAQFVR